MLQLNAKPMVGPAQASAIDRKQPRRLQVALFLLLVAFAITVMRDRQFWFGGSSQDSDLLGPEVEHQAAQPVAVKAAAPALPAPAVKKQAVAKIPDDAGAPDSGVVATERKAAPPLDIEVIAGDTHHTIHPGSNLTKVEMSSARPAFAGARAAQPGPVLSAATNAAEREQIATSVQPGLDANYPLLAQQMKVQGSVVLQALIGTDGVIQNIRVLSGPSILASAAQQAVRQWKFKPYLQGGQAVETMARITVNFTIRVADNSPTSQLGM
ncbi:MAG TPA: energy transducer TonB [Candidatus Sulfotelmatobacter sp.]|nr:energy transducer TonB [Candidatus Sulfotelmatobacter sp.]